MLAVLVPAEIVDEHGVSTDCEIKLQTVDDPSASIDLSLDDVSLRHNERVMVDLRALQRALQVIEQEQSIAHGAAIRTTAAEHF